MWPEFFSSKLQADENPFFTEQQQTSFTYLMSGANPPISLCNPQSR